jgi:Xaa-Pro aminopeptidase
LTAAGRARDNAGTQVEAVMFQNFDEPSDPSVGAPRLALLRQELRRRGLQGFLVPRADEHQGEHPPASALRLTWLTGFSGSAGLAIALADDAAIFVDGRYTLQVRAQVDGAAFSHRHIVDEPPHLWLKAAVKAGDRIGFDPWLTTPAEFARFDKALSSVGASFVAVDGNLVDAVWSDRPAPPKGPVTVYPAGLAGEVVANKLLRVGNAIAEAGADSAVLTRPDAIAWTFNIRGSDVAHTPEPLSFAILRAAGRPSLFIDDDKLDPVVRAHLEAVADIAAPAAFAAALEALGGAVLVDKSSAPYEVVRRVEAGGGRVIEGSDPTVLPKARKNAAELAATRAAHLRDGAAMVRFLCWFDREAPKGGLDEIAAAQALERFRADTGLLKDLSFDSISASGPHAALPHYHVNASSNRKIAPGEIYLIDSGGQYEDGTTDITRTVIVGTPSAEMIDRFTRVLKGHIGIARARFPRGTTGAHIDILARQPLWEAGLDFDHGTGHGVGVYLSVHEESARISKAGQVALEPGMLISNEPGYYKAGAWGIRIENLVVVTEPGEIEGGERPMMGFETVTFCPIDRRLIDARRLTAGERTWIDAYHAEVRAKLLPLVPEGEPRAWLIAATAAL